MQHPDPSLPSCESPLPERLLLRLADLSKLSTTTAVVVIGIDDTIERRWGQKISARHLP